MSRGFLPFLALGAVLACSRPQPSPEYERARALWTELVRARPEAPAADPRSDEVLMLLERVPEGSVDALAAATLHGRIEAERRELAEERARRERLVAVAGIPLPPVAPASVPGAAAAAARTPEPGRPAIPVGMKLEDFQAGYGACFEDGGAVQVERPDSGARPGKMWVIKDDQRCRDAHPELAGQLVLFVEDAVAGVRPATALRRVEVRREVAVGTLPDGGPGMVVDGKVVPLPPGAKLVTKGGGTAP